MMLWSEIGYTQTHITGIEFNFCLACPEKEGKKEKRNEEMGGGGGGGEREREREE